MFYLFLRQMQKFLYIFSNFGLMLNLLCTSFICKENSLYCLKSTSFWILIVFVWTWWIQHSYNVYKSHRLLITMKLAITNTKSNIGHASPACCSDIISHFCCKGKQQHAVTPFISFINFINTLIIGYFENHMGWEDPPLQV